MSRLLPLSCLFLLLVPVLAACGGTPADSSGSGGDTSTTTGGAGGQTSSAGAAGGGTGGTGGGSGCSPECVSPKVCDEGTCQLPVELSIVAEDAEVFASGASIGHNVRARVCSEVRKDVPPPEIIAEEGGCVVYGLAPASTGPIPLQTGETTVASENAGALLLVPNAQQSCVEVALDDAGSLPPGAGFLPGETVTFTTTGGAMFPATTHEVAFPEELGLLGDPVFVSGQPYTVDWTGPTPKKVFLLASVGDGAIECTPGAGTSLTVPASVTEHLVDINSTTVAALLEESAVTEVSPSRKVTATAHRLVGFQTE